MVKIHHDCAKEILAPICLGSGPTHLRGAFDSKFMYVELYFGHRIMGACAGGLLLEVWLSMKPDNTTLLQCDEKVFSLCMSTILSGLRSRSRSQGKDSVVHSQSAF